MIWEDILEDGRQARAMWPGDSDAEKACRAFAAYKALVQLLKISARDQVLAFLDPNKHANLKHPTVYGVSERHIRRVETIHKRRPKQFGRLEEIAKTGTVSLETIEHLVLHPSTDLVEVVWLVLDNK